MLVAMTGVIPAVAGALVQELVDLATILYALRALRGASSGLPPQTEGRPRGSRADRADRADRPMSSPGMTPKPTHHSCAR